MKVGVDILSKIWNTVERFFLFNCQYNRKCSTQYQHLHVTKTSISFHSILEHIRVMVLSLNSSYIIKKEDIFVYLQDYRDISSKMRFKQFYPPLIIDDHE